jgi:osmotically-inducible protein OsmY
VKMNAELQRDVMNELKWEPTIHAAEIGVSVKDGMVTLNGDVDSYSKKWAIDRAVRRVSGVKAVTEEIKVTLPGSYKRTDEDIVQSATNVLKWNLWVPGDRVKVRVKDGWITLTGDVDWHYQKDHAEKAVRHLKGVVGVSNSITIKPKVPTVKPSEVKNGIEDALKRNAKLLLAAQKIQVKTLDGKVILSGNVGSLADYEEAEYTAYCAPGVSEVENNLRVTG